MRTVVKDGQSWRVGTSAEVAWIEDATSHGLAINAAIPEVFEGYATLVLPAPTRTRLAADRERHRQHEQVVLAVLKQNTADQPWWLGFLDTGSDDVVFPDAPMVTMYAGWRYVLVEAGPEQAATWRRSIDEITPRTGMSTVTATATFTPIAPPLTQPNSGEAVSTSATGTGQASPTPWFSKGALPDLMFPADRSWLFSTLWDDDWTCIGGSARLVADFLQHPDLDARQVVPGEDATPPGHTAY